MTGNIVGEQFDEFVREQIKKRQSNQFGGYGTSLNSLRTDTQLQYLTNRNAWVKLASSVEIEIDSLGDSTFSPKLDSIGLDFSYAGTKLAEAAILFNTLSSYTNSSSPLNSRRAGISNTNTLWNTISAYGIGGTNFGIQPPPGIISVQVDSLNRGSIRKANITLKAHNRFQFDLIELLYLRLGFTMMLEWGWDRYLDNSTGSIKQVGNTIIEENWFTSKNITQLEMLGIIQAKREEYNGNYDGFFGKVSNFTWSFNPNGTYDITIDLITVGDVIESIKTNAFAKGSFVGTNSTEQQFKTIASTVSLSPDNIILKAAAVSSVVEYLFGKIESINTQYGVAPSGGAVAQVRGLDDNFITALGTTRKIRNYFELCPPQTSPSPSSHYYVRLGEFLSKIEGLIVPQVENGTSRSPQVNLNYITEDNLVSFFPNQISLDPKICIVRPFIAYGDINGVTFPSYLDTLESYITIQKNPTSGKLFTLGYLMNVYINIEYIAGLLTSNGSPNQEVSLFKFLQDLCGGINDALGGVNKIEPIIKNDNIITLIDQTLSIPEVDIVKLEVYGYNPKDQTSNFVKDIKFVSKISPELASMISIGATAVGSNTSEIDGTAFSKWSEGLTDRFTQKITEPKLEDLTVNPTVAALTREWNNDFRHVGWVARTFKFKEVHKIVTNPKYRSIYNQPITLSRFIEVASEILSNNTKNNIWYGDDLAILTSKNYGVYLVQAFGGEIKEIKIYSSSNLNNFSPFSRSISEGRYVHFNDTFINQGKGAYKNYLNKLNQERFDTDGIPSSEVGFIPLSFEVVLEGISGIKIYNKLSVNTDFLPSNYPESLNFVITKVNHQISNNNWDTSLSTISMPHTEPYKYGGGGFGINTGNTGGGNTGSGGTGTGFDPGNLFTNNSRSVNAWKLPSDPTVPVENGFLHRYPGMLLEADTALYNRLDMQNTSDNKKFRLFYPAMPYFINLLDAYEKAVSKDGKTFLQKYGKLTINSCYRAIQNTPGGNAAAAPGTSRHGLGLAVDLQQPASYPEVHEWFKTNAPGLGWMRIPLLSNGINETWHWELQYEGTYAKIDKNTYAITSNIKNNGRNGSKQYKVSIRNAKGVNDLNSKYVLDIGNGTTGNLGLWGKQIANQTLPIL